MCILCFEENLIKENHAVYCEEKLIQRRPRLKFGWVKVPVRLPGLVHEFELWRCRWIGVMEVGGLWRTSAGRIEESNCQPWSVGWWVVSRSIKYSSALLAAAPNRPPASKPPPPWSRRRTRNPSSPPRRRWGTPAPSSPGFRNSSPATLPTRHQVRWDCGAHATCAGLFVEHPRRAGVR